MAQKLAFSTTPVASAARVCTVSSANMRSASAFHSRPAFGTATSSRILTAQRRAAIKAQALVDTTEANFDQDVIQASNEVPVLVDFWATWCGPCKLVAPSMKWASEAYAGDLKVVKIDCTDENKAVMEQYKVYGLPCLMIFKGGAKIEESHREGAITKKGLVEYLEKQIGVKAAV